MQDLVISQITLSAVVVVLLEHLKKASWFPWLTQEGEKAKRVAAAVLAGLTAIGLQWNYDASTATLTIVGLSWAALAHGMWHWIQSYATQEILYKGVFRDSAPAAVVNNKA